jgi:hypothetical protein
MLDTFPISEMGRLLQRFPKIELSYETISHKKVLPAYDVAIAIPHGKKYFAWFSFYGHKNVVYFLELNKERKIVKIQMREHHLGAKISCDTVVYGVLLAETEKQLEIPRGGHVDVARVHDEKRYIQGKVALDLRIPRKDARYGLLPTGIVAPCGGPMSPT